MCDVLQTKAIRRMQTFMQWLTQLCCDNLHPGVAHARCHFAIHCLQVVLMAYADDRWLHGEHNGTQMSNGNSDICTRTSRVQKKFRKGPEWLQDPASGNSKDSLLSFDPLAACIRRSESFVQVLHLTAPLPCLLLERDGNSVCNGSSHGWDGQLWR